MRRPAHHLIVGADRIHDVEAEQRDVRRLEDVTAGVEHDIRQVLACGLLRRLLAEPDQIAFRELQPRQHGHILANLAELGDAGLAPFGHVLRCPQHGEPRHRQQEARVDAVVACLDAFAAGHAGLGPFLGFLGALAGPQDVEHAGHHGLRVGAAEAGGFRDRTCFEAGAALGAGVEHLFDAPRERRFESAVFHADESSSKQRPPRAAVRHAAAAAATGRSSGATSVRFRPSCLAE